MTAMRKEGQVAQKEPKNAAAGEVGEFPLVDAHPNHENHLCHIVMLRNMKRAASLSQDAEHICFLCGRAAKEQKNLCEPVKI